jgi:hypothetical protein
MGMKITAVVMIAVSWISSFLLSSVFPSFLYFCMLVRQSILRYSNSLLFMTVLRGNKVEERERWVGTRGLKCVKDFIVEFITLARSQ